MSNSGNMGRLFWITGLSGVGKTTTAKALYDYLTKSNPKVVLLDGDVLRTIYNNDDYSDVGRDAVAYTNCRLCKMLVDQGLDVVAAFIGMRDAYREWNRENINNYYEIYIKAPIEVLINRDDKGVYKNNNVYGIDIRIEEPKNPNCIIYNDFTRPTGEIINEIVDTLGI